MDEIAPYTPTADWVQLHDYYYLKTEIYTLSWDVSFNSHVGVGGRFGGPIAVSKDTRKGGSKDSSNSATKPSIRIYSQSGKLLGTIVWDAVCSIVTLGVADSEHIVVVCSDCTIRVFTPQGDPMLPVVSLCGEVREQGGVAEAQVWGSGVAVMTKRGQFCLVTSLLSGSGSSSSLDDAQCMMMASWQSSGGQATMPTSWTVVEPQFTLTGNPEVLVATPSGSIVVLEQDRATDMKVQNGPFTRMQVSPTGKILAAFAATGQLWVVSTDFSQNLCEFNTKSKVPPHQIAWCGVECVACYWDGVLLIVGPYGDWLKYDYDPDSSLVLISEVDGLRILSSKTAEFFHRVPVKTEAIFKIGSTHPAAMLYDANSAFHEKSPKADEHIRVIKNQNSLEAAVSGCIESAVQEWSIVGQKNLLSAASFGKCFLTGHDPQPFVDACQELRLLNACRAAEVGMPLSHLQYVVLTPSVVIDRLINRHHHFLAWNICNYLKLRPNRVLIHWASTMVKKGRGAEQDLCNAIVQKLHAIPGISYAEIASTAFKSGRPNLATRLLEHEPRAAYQIPLLISMQQEDLALQKAIESGDTDLVFLVLLRAMRSMKDDFFQILTGKPIAVKLLMKYAQQQDLPLLAKLLQFIGDSERFGDATVRKALAAGDPSTRAKNLESAADYYARSKTATFQKECCSDEVKLIRLQMDLEMLSQSEQYVGLSCADTLKALIVAGQDKKAESFCKDFKISEARFWWAKLLALSEKGRWDLLRKFADSKKSPIGYAPFADACMAAGNLKEAKEYVSRISEVHVQASLYVRMEAFREAAVCADQLKDPNALLQIRQKCKNKDDAAFVDQLIAKYK